MGECLIHNTSIPFKAWISVRATPNSTVTASLNGAQMSSGTADASGDVILLVKKKGTYSVTSNASGTQTKTVTITTRKETQSTNIVGEFTLTLNPQSINNKSATTITVNRISSPYASASTGNLVTGAAIYYGDVLTITAGVTSTTIYNTATLTVNSTTFTSGNNHTVQSDVTAVATTTVKSYTLTITNSTINNKSAATVSVSRTSSTNQGASSGSLSNNATIYYGDVLTITANNANSTIYNTPTLKVNNSAFTSGNTHTVTADVAAVVTTTVKSYKVTITNSTINSKSAATATVNRTSSTNQGASTGNLANNAVIYYGDVLTISAALSNSTIYTSLSLKVDNAAFTSGNTKTVTNNVAVVVTAAVKSFTLTISAGSGSSLSVTRSSSPNQGASTGALSSGVTVYYGDIISKSSGAASTGFNSYTITPSGLTYGSGAAATGPWTVTGTCSLTASASPIRYTLTSSGLNANYAVTIKRTARSTAGTAAGVSINVNLSNGAAIYYGDTLSFTPSATTNYTGNYTVTGLNTNISASTATVTGRTVTGNVTATSTATANFAPSQMTRYYIAYAAYRDFSGSGIDKYITGTSVNAATSTDANVSRVASISGNRLNVGGGRQSSSSESINETFHEGYAAKVTSALINLNGKTSLTVNYTVNAMNTSSGSGTYYSCGLMVKYSTALPSWTNGTNTSRTSSTEYPPFSSSYTRLGSTTAFVSGSSPKIGTAQSFTTSFSGLTGNYYIMILLYYSNGPYDAYPSAPYCGVTINSVSIS